VATTFDVVILIIAIVLGISGFMHGLIRSVCRFVALLSGFLVSWMFYPSLQGFLVSKTSSADGNSAAITAFIIIFVAVSFTVLMLGRLLVKIAKELDLGWIDKLGGLALGLFKAGIVAWAACLSVSSLPDAIYEEKFGKSTVLGIYDNMPEFFSLDSMEDWRDSVRGVKKGVRGTDDNSKQRKGGEDDGIDDGLGDFDSPLQKKQKKSSEKKGKTVDI